MAREIEELMEAIQMLEVTDEKIQKWSDGEVTWPGKRLGDKDSLLDPEIFGVLGMLSTRMGHINLPVPVVNVQYLYGKRPILPELLGMSRTEVELFAYGSLYAEFKMKDGKWKLVRKMGEREYVEFSDTDPLKVPAATPTPSPAPKKKEQHLRAKIVSVSTSTMTVVPQTTGSELTVPLTSVPIYFKGGMAPGSYVNIIYTGKFNGESTNGMKIRGITGEDPDTLSIRNISSTVTGTILGTTANTVLIQTYDGVKILCSRENVQDLSTSGMEEGADLRVTFNPAKSRTSNIYTCIKFEDP